jgi:hypothetical protein
VTVAYPVQPDTTLAITGVITTAAGPLQVTGSLDIPPTYQTPVAAGVTFSPVLGMPNEFTFVAP